MFTTQIHVHTHNDPEGLDGLLFDIFTQRLFGKATVFVWNSGDPVYPVHPGIQNLLPNPPTARQSLFQPIWDMVRIEKPERVICLADDLRLQDDFWPRTLVAWSAIEDPAKGALRFLGTIGKIDGAFFAPLALFKALDFRCGDDCEERARRAGLTIHTASEPAIVESSWGRTALNA